MFLGLQHYCNIINDPLDPLIVKHAPGGGEVIFLSLWISVINQNL